jgi:HK97 family phage prohead protease
MLMQLKNAAAIMAHAEFGLAEIKFAADDGAEARSFSGYGAVFNNVDSYGDVIDAGAFKKSLGEARKSGAWPAMLLQHGGWGMNAEDMTPIGIWTEMDEDDKGLKVTGKLADTQRGNEVYGLLKMTPRPALNGLSIGYRARKFTMGTKAGEPRRRLHELDLVEVSLVTMPANPKARVGSVNPATASEYEMRRRPCVRRASRRMKPRRSSPRASERSITGRVMVAITCVSATPSAAR